MELVDEGINGQRRGHTIRQDPVKRNAEHYGNDCLYQEQPLPPRKSMRAIKMRERKC
jgi:hypothetical protein